MRETCRHERTAHPVVGIRKGALHLQPRSRDNARAVGENRLAVQHELGEALLRERDYTGACNAFSAASHLGWNINGVSDEELIAGTHNIDLVLGGHSHTYFAAPEVLKNSNGQWVPDNQMGKNGRYVGTLRLNLRKKAK